MLNSKGKRATDKTAEPVVKKPKNTRHGAISRRKRSLTPTVSMNSSSPSCGDRSVLGCQSPTLVCTVTSDAQSPLDNVPTPGTKMRESKSTQTDFERCETPRWLLKKTMPTTPMVLQTDPRLKKHKPSGDDTLSDEQSKLIIDI